MTRNQPCSWASSDRPQTSNELDGVGGERNQALAVELAEWDLEERALFVGANAVVLEAAELADAEASVTHQEQRPGAWFICSGEAAF
jgi:hypothetical protein